MTRLASVLAAVALALAGSAAAGGTDPQPAAGAGPTSERVTDVAELEHPLRGRYWGAGENLVWASGVYQGLDVTIVTADFGVR